MRKDFLFVTTHYSFSSLSSKQGRGFALGNRCSFPNRDKKKKMHPKQSNFDWIEKDLLLASFACIFWLLPRCYTRASSCISELRIYERSASKIAFIALLQPRWRAHFFLSYLSAALFSLRYPTILFAHFSSSLFPLLPSWTFSFV